MSSLCSTPRWPRCWRPPLPARRLRAPAGRHRAARLPRHRHGPGLQPAHAGRRGRGQPGARRPPAAASPDGPKAGDDLPEREGAGRPERRRVHAPRWSAITAWVAPRARAATTATTPENLADDSMYTKVVARRMMQMTQHINTDWKTARRPTPASPATPATAASRCPANVWFTRRRRTTSANFIGDKAGQNTPADSGGAGLAAVRPVHALPAGRRRPIRVDGTTALPTGNAASHPADRADLRPDDAHVDSRWASTAPTATTRATSATGTAAPPQRATAWHGIRMVRDLNNDYIDAADRQRSRPTAWGRPATWPRSTAPPATRASTSRCTARRWPRTTRSC